MIYLITDGAEANGLEYFEWIIGTDNKILVQHKGHVMGNSSLIELLRTKSIGALSTLCFINYFCVYHKTKIN